MRPLHRLAREAAQSASAETLQSALTAALKEQLDADVVRLLEVAQDRSGALAPGRRLRFTADQPSGTARVIATGRPLVVPDAYTSTEVLPGIAEEFGTATVLFLPLT